MLNRQPKPKPELPQSYDAPVLDNVTCNRFEYFLELGYSASDAEDLAGTRADWHYVKKLIDAGCPHATAARIAR